jgi:hypothetical protein
MSFHGLRSGIRQGPRLAKRHPNGESEGIWDHPTPMVKAWPEERYGGHPQNIRFSGGREKCGTQCPEGTSSPWGGGDPHSLVGRASCNLALGFQGNERENTAQRGKRTHRGREDLEGRLAGGGWQLEVRWGGGTSLWACERVVFSRIWGPGKAAQILKEGNGNWERESERAQDGVREARRERSVLGTQPHPSHSTKC